MLVATLIALVLVLVIAVLVAWLKGTLGLVGEVIRDLARRSGEPWTWAGFFEPALGIPVVFVAATVGLARPESRWARWFYGAGKIDRSRARFG